MNRRLGTWIQVGLFALVPAGAFAQRSPLSRDTGINPLQQDQTLTPDQKKAGDIDQKIGNPNLPSLDEEKVPSVGSRSDTMGTSGSSGAPVGEKKEQGGTQMSGSSGAPLPERSGTETPAPEPSKQERKGRAPKETRPPSTKEQEAKPIERTDEGATMKDTSKEIMPKDSSDLYK